MKRLSALLPRLTGRRASFKIGVVATLAIAVAANVAVLGNLGVMFGRVVPGATHQHLLEAYMQPLQNKALPSSAWGVYRPIYDHLASSLAGQAETALYQTRGGTLASGDTANGAHFIYLRATPSLARVLGVHAVAGRLLDAADEQRGASPVMVLSGSAARARFGTPRAAIGKALSLDGKTYRVVGVLPDRFAFPADHPSSGWVTFPPEKAGPQGSMGFGLHALIRPGPGTSRQVIRTALGRAYTEALPEYNNGMRHFIEQAKLVPRIDTLAKRAYGPITTQLQLLELAALLLLLLVFANLAGLATSDMLARRHELATRVALGAGASRLFAERARELGALGLIAWAVGIGLGWLGNRALTQVIGQAGQSVTFSVPVLLLTLAAVLIITTLLAGTGIRRLRTPNALCSDLMSGGHATGGRGLTRALRAFIVLQLTISMVLLVTAGHLRANVFGLTNGDLGFTPHERTFASFILPGGQGGRQTRAQYEARVARASKFDQRLLGRLKGVPGIENAALLSITPFSNGTSFTSASTKPSIQDTGTLINVETVSQAIAPALGLRVLAGNPGNVFSAKGEAIFIDAAAARHYWPGMRFSDVVGQSLYAEVNKPLRVAAVVESLRMKPYGSTGITMFVPYDARANEMSGGRQSFVIHSRLAPNLLRGEIIRVMHEINPQAKLLEFHPANELVSGAYIERDHLARLFGTLSLIAILIAAVGLFALLAYRTLVRRAEFAIRSAIGATQRRLHLIVIREALLLWIAGSIIGMPAAYLLARVLAANQPQLGLPAGTTVAGVLAVVLAITACAAFVPARRAARADIHDLIGGGGAQ